MRHDLQGRNRYARGVEGDVARRFYSILPAGQTGAIIALAVVIVLGTAFGSF
jgi:hypothetical protein